MIACDESQEATTRYGAGDGGGVGGFWVHVGWIAHAVGRPPSTWMIFPAIIFKNLHVEGSKIGGKSKDPKLTSENQRAVT